MDNLNLLNNSQVHWDIQRSNDGIYIQVTCGLCHKDRWVRRGAIRPGTFTGLCRSCCHKVMLPPPAKSGYKHGYTRTLTKGGYITLVISGLNPKDQDLCLEMGQKNGGSSRILEHRLVMARHLGRPLLRSEIVHHINGNRQDNRDENLELYIEHHVKGQRANDLLKEITRLKSILELYHILY